MCAVTNLMRVHCYHRQACAFDWDAVKQHGLISVFEYTLALNVTLVSGMQGTIAHTQFMDIFKCRSACLGVKPDFAVLIHDSKLVALVKNWFVYRLELDAGEQINSIASLDDVDGLFLVVLY